MSSERQRLSQDRRGPRTPAVVLSLDEPLQRLLGAPPRDAPRIVVRGCAAVVQRRVRGAAAAQQLPARQVDLRGAAGGGPGEGSSACVTTVRCTAAARGGLALAQPFRSQVI